MKFHELIQFLEKVPQTVGIKVRPVVPFTWAIEPNEGTPPRQG